MISKNNINWLQILATVCITTLVGIASAYVVNSINNPTMKLTYKMNSGIPFTGNEVNTNIYHLEVSNNCKSVIENISSHIEIKDGAINNYSIERVNNLTVKEKSDSTSLSLEIENLNPEESIKFSILVTSNNKLENEPIVSLRATGVKGEKFKEKEFNLDENIWFVLPIVLLLASLLSSFTSKKISKNLNKLPIEYNDQADLLAYLCYEHGLGTEAEFYLNSQNENIKYWTESERLTFKALNSTDDDYDSKVLSILSLIEEDDNKLSNRSKCIINYNVARIYYKKGDSENLKKYINKALDVDKSLVERRLSKDDELKNAANIALPQ